MVNHEALAVYRSIARAGRMTFKGDKPALLALRTNLRERFQKNAQETDQTKVAENLKVGRQVATILARNVVQGVRSPGTDTYKLQLDKDRHEINDNPPFKTCTDKSS
ncbi:hypothetical protein H4R33_004121 [Dimargaris cristalligena]|uniref:Mitochondrial zinc maintenance protein 1, mitochondrial n=1 Tax=Dimargaris cristalligena TaxID=215637 RepID=A0A4P9ZVF7_9FUNG|nr:hypothetical protein H4R33_004121 [Dimargaris cristalligena]RKP36610.1 hypothetical protein BJ085DRAFT_35752 [Dimargaris cristalligena]|eukprot:RKP36610.1 hypothetical protein BJ085DRAFT_35752 [Dimargaris cristalligena]